MASATVRSPGIQLGGRPRKQHRGGQWNLAGQAGVLFAVGNGADARRSDAFQVDVSGNVMTSGTIVPEAGLGGAHRLSANASGFAQHPARALQTQLDSLGGN